MVELTTKPLIDTQDKMTKVKSITVRNFKAVSDQELSLNGASAIITAGNNKGKTSVLRGLVDRFQGEKPEIIVKQGEEKGVNVMELTDGSKIGWSFTHKTENFSFTTAEDIKMTTGVLSAIGEKYFGSKFNIDRFISSSKNEQIKQVQQLLGIDLSSLEERYKSKYQDRTLAKRELTALKGENRQEPQKVEKPNIDGLKAEKKKLEAIAHNKKQKEQKAQNDRFLKFKSEIEKSFTGNEFSQFINFHAISERAKSLPSVDELMKEDPLALNLSLEELNMALEEAYALQAKHNAYENELKGFVEWTQKVNEKQTKVNSLEEDIDGILKERYDLISKANLPEEFEMTESGLLYNGLPLDNNQISTSAKYICALKLGALVLGKIRTMHFDASYLDRNSLNEIQKWAEKNDLQLLIERPDYDGGEITYKIIEA